MITDHQRHLKLSDIAGLPIGHAPRVLVGFFWTVLDEDGSVYAVATGELLSGHLPGQHLGWWWSSYPFNCSYYIKRTPSKFEYNLSLLSSTLEKNGRRFSVMNVPCM